MSSKISSRHPAPEEVVASNATENCVSQERHARIAEAAFFLSERRRAAGEPPDELLDWLEAERAIDPDVTLPRGHDHTS